MNRSSCYGWQDSVRLTDSERRACHLIAQDIETFGDHHVILKRLKTSSLQVSNTGFFYFYAGILLARRGRYAAARRVFHLSECDVLCSSLARLMRSGNTFEFCVSPAIYVGFHAWDRTSIALCIRRKVATWIIHCIGSDKHRQSIRRDTIVDLGCGDGKLAVEVCHLLTQKCTLPRVRRVVLVDKIGEALKDAGATLTSRFGSDLEVIGIHSSMESVRINDVCDPERIIAVNACQCLHELPIGLKQDLLTRIARLPCRMAISELEGNHESPKDGSVELLHSVHRFYSPLIADVENSGLCQDDKTLCVGDFLLKEVVELAFNPYKKRSNYHMLLSEWERLLGDSGFKPRSELPCPIRPGGPVLLRFWL